MKEQGTILKILENIEKVMVGKREVCELTLLTLLCEGHLLIEDVPGVGKTSLAMALARSVDSSFQRISFTPDILPSDITGFSLYNQKTGEFEHRPGLIMRSFILADEINRASPKTQASLLEVMEENQVTVDAATYRVPLPFMVLATQNPTEYLGTYPLPEAQIDRFFIKLTIGYPSKTDEEKVLSRFREKRHKVEELSPVATGAEILALQERVRQVAVDPLLYGYITDIIWATRLHPDTELGASPRGSLALMRAAQGWALMQGREFILPDDIKDMSRHVLGHRILLKQEARIRGVTPSAILEEALRTAKVPLGKDHGGRQ